MVIAVALGDVFVQERQMVEWAFRGFPEDRDPLVHCSLHAMMEGWIQQSTEVQPIGGIALRIAINPHTRRARFRAWYLAGKLYAKRQKWLNAQSAYQRAFDCLDMSDRIATLHVLRGLGQAALNQGDYSLAVSCYRQMITIWEDASVDLHSAYLGNDASVHLTHLYVLLAQSELLRGNLDDAHTLFDRHAMPMILGYLENPATPLTLPTQDANESLWRHQATHVIWLGAMILLWRCKTVSSPEEYFASLSYADELLQDFLSRCEQMPEIQSALPNLFAVQADLQLAQIHHRGREMQVYLCLTAEDLLRKYGLPQYDPRTPLDERANALVLQCTLHTLRLTEHVIHDTLNQNADLINNEIDTTRQIAQREAERTGEKEFVLIAGRCEWLLGNVAHEQVSLDPEQYAIAATHYTRALELVKQDTLLPNLLEQSIRVDVQRLQRI